MSCVVYPHTFPFAAAAQPSGLVPPKGLKWAEQYLGAITTAVCVLFFFGSVCASVCVCVCDRIIWEAFCSAHT